MRPTQQRKKPQAGIQRTISSRRSGPKWGPSCVSDPSCEKSWGIGSDNLCSPGEVGGDAQRARWPLVSPANVREDAGAGGLQGIKEASAGKRAPRYRTLGLGVGEEGRVRGGAHRRRFPLGREAGTPRPERNASRPPQLPAHPEKTVWRCGFSTKKGGQLNPLESGRTEKKCSPKK